MKKNAAAVILVLFMTVLGLHLFGVTPQKWELRSKDDYLKGKLDGLSLSFEGVLALASHEEKIQGPAEDFFLSLQPAPDGSLFLGTGHGGKVFRIGQDGRAELFFQTQELDVTSLVLDKKGVLYAGTSPNGKIYRIPEKGKGEPFFNPDEKYIWDLLFLENGLLIVAVGERSGIYEVNAQGEGRVVFKAEENHILCLETASGGDIIAGSGGGGIVYRVAPGGRASILFESPFEEVRSLALDKEGNVFAAASGTPFKAKKEEVAPATLKTPPEVTVSVSATMTEVSGLAFSAQKEPSAVYRISPDGLAKRLWHSVDELIYSLLWNEAEKKIVFGTGNRGKIYAVDKEGKGSLLVQEHSEQVYYLHPAWPKFYVVANNPAYLGIIHPDQRSSGEFLSSVLDTKTISSWGKVMWEAELPAGTTLQLQTRTGNSFEPGKTWSDWSPPYQKSEEQVLSPKARYIQMRILFRSQSGKVSPQLQKVSLFYVQANIAPVITKLELLAPNEVFIKLPEQEDIIWGAAKNPPVQEEKKEGMRGLALVKKSERKGFQTVLWEAEDENNDALIYTLSIRKDGESLWRLLEENWRETIYAFDTLTLPDGAYFIRVQASDSPANPPGTELKAEKTSQLVTIDNSLPVIRNFAASKTQNFLEVSFDVEDTFSPIEKAEFLIRPADWKVVFPTDGICDSRQESFKFRVPLSLTSDNLITVRVWDRYRNIGVFRQTF